MSTELHHEQKFTAPAADIYALFADRDYLEGRLQAAGGIDPEITELDSTGDGVKIITRQSIPASVLPSMVASMMPGDPLIVRTENWRAEDAGYLADLDVQIKGAPASLKGTMSLQDDGSGSTLTTDAKATVPIPMFGGKIEGTIVEQVDKLLTAEEKYTQDRLGKA